MATSKLVLVTVAVAAMLASAAAQFGGADIRSLINNPAKLTEMVQCLLADTDDTCSLQGRLLKSLLPQLLQSNCAMCSEPQRQDVAGVLRVLVNDRPQDWQRLVTKYDPTGTLRNEHGPSWRARGVNL